MLRNLYRSRHGRSAGALCTADLADGLECPVSTPPCTSRSSLQPASILRQRTPPPRAPPNHGTKESNARPYSFPLTAIVDHPRRGFSAWPARFRRTFLAEAQSPFWSQSTRPSWRRQERSRPAAAAQTLPLRFADSSPQASCGPSPPKTLLGTWEFTAPHVRSGSMSRFSRDQIQKEKHHVQLQKQRTPRR